jgi:hypothetical protein
MKKIYRKLLPSEHPVFTDESHDHLTVCDFRNKKIIHYFDPENEEFMEMLLTRDLKDDEMDRDLENVAKDDFTLHYKIGGFDISNNRLSRILNFCRKSDENTDLIKSNLLYIYKNVFKKIKNPNILDFGKFDFGEMFLLLALLSDTTTDKVNWLFKSQEIGNDDSKDALKKVGAKILKTGLQIESISYVIDDELFAYGFDFDEIDLDQSNGFFVDSQVFAGLKFEVPEDEYSEITNWFNKNN